MTLAIFVLGVLFLPYLAAVHHVVYDMNQTIVTGVIAALSGIISACAIKKIQKTSCDPSDAIADQKVPPIDDK